jgi:hypothetical protein
MNKIIPKCNVCNIHNSAYQILTHKVISIYDIIDDTNCIDEIHQPYDVVELLCKKCFDQKYKL